MFKRRLSYIIMLCLIGGILMLSPSIFLNQQGEQDSEVPHSSILDGWSSSWDQYDNEYGRGLVIDDETGDIYVVGYNGTLTNNDIILIKYDNSGNELWNITWDGGANEIGYDIALDSMDNIYIAGGNGTTFPNLDGLLLKFNSTGQLIWKRSYNGGSYDTFWALQIDSNDDIYVVSQSIIASYDTIVLKYNNTGDVQWISTFDGPGYQSCYDISLDGNGNILLAGLNGSAPSYNYLVVKMDSSGNHLWNRTWGGSGSDQAYAVGVDSSNNVYITGFSNSFGSSNKDITLVKYDVNGNKLWNKTWDSSGSWSDESWSLAFDSAGYVYVGGYQVNGDIFILKYNSEGTLMLEKYWDRGTMYSNWCYDLIIDNSDIIYLTGHTLLTAYYDIILVQLSIESPGGFTLWTNANDPDDDGNFTLYWSLSPRANNYSLYYSNISANIDIESDNPWIETIWAINIDISLGNGTYYFLVSANNDKDRVVSNYISVTVEIEPSEPTDGNGQPPPGIPGFSSATICIVVIGITLIIVVRTKKFLK